MMLGELTGDDELINEGNGDSSSGSDENPSEDNLDVEDLCQIVPPVDKSLKKALKTCNKKKKKAEDDSKQQKDKSQILNGLNKVTKKAERVNDEEKPMKKTIPKKRHDRNKYNDKNKKKV